MNGSLDAHLFVILGGTGDLAARKLLPAIYHLSRDGNLSERYAVLAVSRDNDMDDAAFRSWAHDALERSGLHPSELADWCDANLFYHPIGEGRPDDYHALRSRIELLERALGLPGNRAFYLALPPRAFPTSIEGMAEAGLHRSSGWTRLVVEKPFGRDLESAGTPGSSR